MSRPRKEISWADVEKLCGLQCTHDEISWFLGVSEDTLTRACKREHGITFAEYFAQKRGMGRISLRRAQWQAAQKGNVTMLIWLGKQYLGQTDKIVQTDQEQDRPLEDLSDSDLLKMRGDG